MRSQNSKVHLKKNPVEITNNINNVTEYKINLQGLITCLHTNSKHSEKEIRYIPSHNNLQKHDVSKNKCTKELQNLNNNNNVKMNLFRD